METRGGRVECQGRGDLETFLVEWKLRSAAWLDAVP